MQATIKIIATLAVLGAAITGMPVVLDLISDAAAREILLKTAWILGIVAVASLVLLLMNGPQQK
mgnify:CR=1 FL=1